MRVGVNGLFWGRQTTGTGQYTVELFHALCILNAADDYLVARTAASDKPQHSFPNLRFYGLRTPLDRLSEDWSKLWFEQVAFPQFCARYRVDVAHIPYWAPPLHAPVPVVVTIHDLIPLLLPDYRGNLMVRLYTWLVTITARRANLIVADSEATRRDIVRLLRIAPERVQAVYLAAHSRFRPASAAEIATLRQKAGLPERYILYLGGFDRRKNVPLLLEAYADLLRTWKNVPPLVLAGHLPETNSPLFPNPRHYIERLGLQDRVFLIGQVEEADKPALYTAADLFVFPSEYEGFGLPVLEALSCGTPAITTDGGSLPEILGNGGVLVQVGDQAALTDAMQRILQDAQWREELAQRGLEQARRFSWEETARQMINVYAQLIHRQEGPLCAS